MARRTRGRVAWVAVGAIALLAGCGSSGVEYVENQDAGLFLSAPDGWSQITVDEPERPEDVTSEPWSVVLDRNPDPSADHLQTVLDNDAPIAIVGVEPLELPSVRSRVSHSWLRSLVLGGENDPLALFSNGEPGIEIVAHEEMTTEQGHWGSRIVVNLCARAGETGGGCTEWVTRAQIAMVDPELSRLYHILLVCTADCYEEYRTDIDRIFDSWTIEEQ